VIRDLASTNGTFVGGNRVQDAVLYDGNKVLIGRNTILKFVVQDELERQYQQLMYESSTEDGLTGVYNRRYFDQKLAADLSFAKRQQIPCTLVIFDIDFFKRVNDIYGHRTGDQVLVTVAQSVRQNVRTEDVLARYGGEEFAVIAQGTDFERGRSLGERIWALVGQQTFEACDGSGKIFGLTVSVGVATAPPESHVDSAEIISEADANLYLAKRTGRNRVVTSEIR
jgi:diguanylate cyclase (GGDEF)-like protein